MTNPTERPEERDSLAELEAEMFEELRGIQGLAPATTELLAMQVRTLINEVKERDEKLAELEPYNERLDRRVEQMEEALLPLVVVRNGQGDRAVLRAAQLLALSPTDTEEVSK
jgi:uncharacterized protein (DUF3084 family)